MSETDPAILGVQSCGCITFAHSRPDVLDREDQKAIGEIVASGGQIIRTTVGEARKMPHFLVSECPHNPKGWEPMPYIDPSQRVEVKRTCAGQATVYRGFKRVGTIRREETHKGGWRASIGYINRDGRGCTYEGEREVPVEVIGPFSKRQEAVDALVAAVSEAVGA